MRAWFARRRWARRSLLVASALTLVAALLIGGANAYVLLDTSDEATSRLAQVRPAEVALVLGAYVEPDGHMSQMLADRVQGAAELWHAGKVRKILVSGDHTTWSYDEPDTMRRALQADGVPAADIFTDHDGIDTWYSMVRARRVFGVRDAIVVTQGFHMPRALYLASAAGLHAQGFVTDLHGYGRQGELSSLREVLARVKAVYQGATDAPVQLGPHIAISGDGRLVGAHPPLSAHPPPHRPFRPTQRARIGCSGRGGKRNSSGSRRVRAGGARDPHTTRSRSAVMEPKIWPLDPQSAAVLVARVIDEVDESSEEQRDELLCELLYTAWGNLWAQNQ